MLSRSNQSIGDEQMSYVRRPNEVLPPSAAADQPFFERKCFSQTAETGPRPGRSRAQVPHREPARLGFVNPGAPVLLARSGVFIIPRDLSTSTHHLVQRLGVEQGYNLAKESGRDLEEGIACATAGLRRRFAARVWRDYYKHVDARRRYANPTDEGLAAQQRDRQIEEESRRRENEERVAQYNYFAARASNRSAWARAGMG